MEGVPPTAEAQKGKEAEHAPGFQQGGAGDFSSFGDTDGAAAQGGDASKGGAGLFESFWQATARVANDVGAGGAFATVNKKMNQLKVSQLGDKLEQVDPDPEIDGIMANIKETGKKYREMLATLHDKTEAAARSSGPVRKSGAALIRCAGIADKVARDIATGPGAQGFFKETPTYQQDLNEALLVSSAAILYSADRIQALHTTSVSLDQSRASFEQGSYSTKHYVKREQFGPGAVSEALTALQGLITNQITAAENARRKYNELRLDLSVRKTEIVQRGGDVATLDQEIAQLAIYKEDVLSSYRTLCTDKDLIVPPLLASVISAEKEMHEQAIKSLTTTLSALPNTSSNGPVSGVTGA